MVLRQSRPKQQKPQHRMPDANKPVLAMSRVPVFRVHYQVLEQYIQRVFGFEFDFLMATGAIEGVCPEYQVNGQLPSTEWQRRANELRGGRRTRDVMLILNTLACDKYIPTGKYTISTHALPDPVVLYKNLLEQTRDPQSAACSEFKQRYKDDSTFQQRAAVIDQCWAEWMRSLNR